MEDYANAPQSIGEIRSDKTASGEDWKPRDALIALLRRIDQGEIHPDCVFIAYGATNEVGGWMMAGKAKTVIGQTTISFQQYMQTVLPNA